jgi:hypothetical protein
MKAKDYFTKYEQALVSSDAEECSAAIADMLKEMNQKWNAIVRLLEKKYGATPIVKDGFQLYWVRRMPQLMGKI